MNLIKILFLIVFIICHQLLFAQRFDGTYDEVTDSLLAIIADYQSKGDAYFDEGVFPSYRWYHTSNKVIKDDNIFFTQIILFTLQDIESVLSEDGQDMFKNIKRMGLKNLSV